MNEFTCTSCRGTFTKADPDHGSDGLCAQCKIAFGLVSLHDTAERNHIERLRSLEVVRRYGDAFSAVLEQILPPQPKPTTHQLCPWCSSPGFIMTEHLPIHRYRVACSAIDCSAAPQLNWARTMADAWRLWDTRK
jgi:hypothetical protein